MLLCRHDCVSAREHGLCCRSHSGLVEGRKSDEMMNGRHSLLTTKEIYFQHLFIKPLAKRKVMNGIVFPFSFHQLNPFVEGLMRM